VQAAPLRSTLAVVYLGIGPAALAYVAWVWLGEAPNAIDLLGGALALSGVVVVNTLGRARRPVSSPAPLPSAPSP